MRRSNCGVCTVQLDGKPIESCTVLAVMADGRARPYGGRSGARRGTDPLQQGFVACHGLQCGFALGMLILRGPAGGRGTNPDPTEQEVQVAISGNLCRCTGYENIVRSVRWAAENEAQTKAETEVTA